MIGIAKKCRVKGPGMESSNSKKVGIGLDSVYLIDCKTNKHFASNQWICNESVYPNGIPLRSVDSGAKDIKTETEIETDIVSKVHSVVESALDPLELLEKMREFCGNYLVANRQQKSHLSQVFNKYLVEVIPELCDRLNADILDREPNVVEVSSHCSVFGDIHGNLQDLYEYEIKFWNKAGNEKNNYIFLGDYVDRGLNSVEVSVYLFALKLSQPKRFTLVRGNHEVRAVNKGYTFFAECIRKFGRRSGNIVWDRINRSFERLPLAAVIDGAVFCCHGGVPKSMKTMAELATIPKPLVDPEKESPAAHEMLWNDPIESMTTFNQNTERLLQQKKVEFVANRTRSTGFYFTAQAVKRFLNDNQFTHMIRAHESVKQGFKYTSDGKVITVFSSSNYCGMNNTTACVDVSANQLSIVIIRDPNTRPLLAIPSQTANNYE